MQVCTLAFLKKAIDWSQSAACSWVGSCGESGMCISFFFLFNQGVLHQLLIFIICVAVNLSSLVCELENQNRIWPSFLIYLNLFFFGEGRGVTIYFIYNIYSTASQNTLVYVKLVNGGEKKVKPLSYKQYVYPCWVFFFVTMRSHSDVLKKPSKTS